VEGYCEYAGCAEPLEGEQPKTGIKLCAKHDAEFTAIARREPFNPGALIKFWIDARGGPQVLAKEMTEDMKKDGSLELLKKMVKKSKRK
jgi:hypothetical protein